MRRRRRYCKAACWDTIQRIELVEYRVVESDTLAENET